MEYIKAKKILQRTVKGKFDWFGNDYNMNLYKGCCHGCIYCDSRSNCYKINNFDTVHLKEDAILKLEQELKYKRTGGVVGIGAMSDTYNPFETKYEVTRNALKLLYTYGFGVSLDTKSDLVVRDIDIIKKISDDSAAIIKLTITTADDELSKKIEPNVCSSSKRLEAVRELSRNGIFTGILFTPMLPFITDSQENVKQIAALAHECGAKFIYGNFGVTLRENQREYYYDRLEELFPQMKEKYITTYGNSYLCNSDAKGELSKLFRAECKKYNILYRMEDIIKAYKETNNYTQISFPFF